MGGDERACESTRQHGSHGWRTLTDETWRCPGRLRTARADVDPAVQAVAEALHRSTCGVTCRERPHAGHAASAKIAVAAARLLIARQERAAVLLEAADEAEVQAGWAEDASRRDVLLRFAAWLRARADDEEAVRGQVPGLRK